MSPRTVVIVGAGAGGLEVAAALTRPPGRYHPIVLEAGDAPFLKQSGTSGGQARWHCGAYYHHDLEVARTIAHEHSLGLDAGIVHRVPCTYVLPADGAAEVKEAWDAAGVFSRKARTGTEEMLAPALRGTGRVVCRNTDDDVIDTERLRTLQEKALRRGGELLCGTRVVGARWKGRRINGVWVRRDGRTRLIPCDFCVNCAGAGLARVAKDLDPSTGLRLGCFRIEATAVLRAGWPFPGRRPQILQFYGNLLEHLSLIPVGRTDRVSVATRGGTAVTDPEAPAVDLEAEKLRLLGLLAEGCGLSSLPGPLVISCCCKALLTAPGAAGQGGAKARLVTVLFAPEVGGLMDNLILAAPGKLGNVKPFARQVVAAVDRHFGAEEVSRAA